MTEDTFYDVLAVLTRIAEALEGISSQLSNVTATLNEETGEGAVRTLQEAI